MTAANRANRNDLVFVPLGGVGEIGLNLYLYGLRDSVVDPTNCSVDNSVVLQQSNKGETE